MPSHKRFMYSFREYRPGIIVEADGKMFAKFRQRLYPVAARLGLGIWPIVQTALAASVAWVLAVLVVGYMDSSFAPVAAILSLGVSIGQRERRALEAIVGTAVGLALAVVLVSIIGSGPAEIAVMVVLGMVVGVLLRGGPLLQNQAAIMVTSVALNFGSTPPVFDTLSSM